MNQYAAQITNLVGGVMTPPYIRCGAGQRFKLQFIVLTEKGHFLGDASCAGSGSLVELRGGSRMAKSPLPVDPSPCTICYDMDVSERPMTEAEV